MTLPSDAVPFNHAVVTTNLETYEKVQLQDGSNGISA